MNSPERHGRDELGDLLGGPEERGGNEALRAAVLASTLGVIRRRRLVRHLKLASALAACYVAGVLTLAVWGQARPNVPVGMGPEVVSESLPRPGPTAPRSTDAAAESSSSRPPGAAASVAEPPVEPRAALPPLSRYEQLCRQGDRYLGTPGGMAQAVQAYKQALNAASDEQAAISLPHDTWLMMALKDAWINEKGSSHDTRKRS